MQNCYVIEPCLSHCWPQVRFDTAEASERSLWCAWCDSNVKAFFTSLATSDKTSRSCSLLSLESITTTPWNVLTGVLYCLSIHLRACHGVGEGVQVQTFALKTSTRMCCRHVTCTATPMADTCRPMRNSVCALPRRTNNGTCPRSEEMREVHIRRKNVVESFFVIEQERLPL